jgi:uncharacterized ParB-like nuclease family protein
MYSARMYSTCTGRNVVCRGGRNVVCRRGPSHIFTIGYTGGDGGWKERAGLHRLASHQQRARRDTVSADFLVSFRCRFLLSSLLSLSFSCAGGVETSCAVEVQATSSPLDRQGGWKERAGLHRLASHQQRARRDTVSADCLVSFSQVSGRQVSLSLVYCPRSCSQPVLHPSRPHVLPPRASPT